MEGWAPFEAAREANELCRQPWQHSFASHFWCAKKKERCLDKKGGVLKRVFYCACMCNLGVRMDVRTLWMSEETIHMKGENCILSPETPEWYRASASEMYFHAELQLNTEANWEGTANIFIGSGGKYMYASIGFKWNFEALLLWLITLWYFYVCSEVTFIMQDFYL